jgi:hypothetical protein
LNTLNFLLGVGVDYVIFEALSLVRSKSDRGLGFIKFLSNPQSLDFTKVKGLGMLNAIKHKIHGLSETVVRSEVITSMIIII